MALLIILLIAFGLILGFFTRQQAFRKLGRVLIMAALTPVFLSLFKIHLSQLSFEKKIIFLAVSVLIGIFALLRILLGKDIFNHFLEILPMTD
ncbi:MAG: hypothetical protein AB1480_12005 [Nitrospirota bacterium]